MQPLNEKPCLGLTSNNPALHPGQNVPNFAAAMGDSRSVASETRWSHEMGRFLSPDWSSDPDTIPYAEFENPQTLNLYSYGHNNPLVYNDPDGHDVTICDNNGNCQAPISDDAYKASQQASNSSLNGPSLAALQNSSSGTGTLTSTDAKGEYDQRRYSHMDGRKSWNSRASGDGRVQPARQHIACGFYRNSYLCRRLWGSVLRPDGRGSR